MKTATLREAQHNLSRILQEVEAGEPVEILRRKKPVARIVPIPNTVEENGTVDWESHGRRMASIWGDTVVAAAEDILHDLRGER